MEYIKLALAIWASGWLICLLLQFLHRRSVSRKIARVQAEQARIAEDARRRANEAREQAQRMTEIQREQMRQAQEQARAERERIRLAKEQEKQAAQLAEHEKRLADLEERMAVAEGEIDFQAQQIERLRAHIEHAETERDACVYGSTRYYQWDKKCLALEKQIHTAESKMAKAQSIKTSAAKELAA